MPHTSQEDCCKAQFITMTRDGIPMNCRALNSRSRVRRSDHVPSDKPSRLRITLYLSRLQHFAATSTYSDQSAQLSPELCPIFLYPKAATSQSRTFPSGSSPQALTPLPAPRPQLANLSWI